MFSWPAPRRGSWFTISTSSATVRSPSPTTWPGIRRAAATSLPSITSSRWSSPRIMLSTIDARALVDRDLEGVRDLVVGGEVHRDAAAVVAVDRLHHHREADVVRGVDRVLGVAHVELPRHRQAEVGEQPGAELLVRGDLDGGVRGLAGQRRLDALLVLALADLDQAGVVQPHPGDVARLGRLHQRQRRGAERRGARRSGRSPRSPRRCRRRRPRGRDQLEDDRAGHVAGLEPDLLELVAVEHLDLVGVRPPGRVNATSAGAPPWFCSATATCAISSPSRQSGLLHPLGERLAALGRRGGEPGQLLEQRRRERVAHTPTPASSARRCRSTVSRISGSLA